MGLDPTCYTNPARLGAVKVVQYPGSDEDHPPYGEHGCTTNAVLVQHRPVATLAHNRYGSIVLSHSPLMNNMVTPCEFLWKGEPSEDQRSAYIEFEIKATGVSLRPTHYSFRMDGCVGASGWDLVASTDGTAWKLLHTVKDDEVTKVNKSHLPVEVFDANGSLDRFRKQIDKAVESGPEHKYNPQEEFQDYLDAHVRQTWALTPSPTEFYRFFRITPQVEWEHYQNECFHAVGFEFYGDVNEE
mmetsp:Transcript_41548/g.110797  ORF Transcript_41548/g.110797 Transcript_41548/m.110797 type:complete len:243 (+) Transcript_41548:211-939(+)